MYQNNFKKFKKTFKNTSDISSQNKAIEASFSLSFNEHFNQDFYRYIFSAWSSPYYSALNHLNLHRISHLEQLSNFPYVLVRDGAYLLIEFFSKFQKPYGCNTTLIIHKSLIKLVPKEWLKNVLFYEFYFDKSQDIFNRNIKKVILKSVIFDTESYVENIKKELIRLKKEGVEHFVILQKREFDLFTKEHKEADDDLINFSLHYLNLKKFLEDHGFDYRIAGFSSLYEIENLQSYYFASIGDDGRYYIDDFSNYFLMSRGAVPLKCKVVKKNEMDFAVSLSHWHGIIVHSSNPLMDNRFAIDLYDEIKSLNNNENVINRRLWSLIRERLSLIESSSAPIRID